ncbi:MAG: hypothetical protein H7276_21405 [Caulobacter sp.]|nr:hypothetical protein [Vitreoscilla sp.]
MALARSASRRASADSPACISRRASAQRKLTSPGVRGDSAAVGRERAAEIGRLADSAEEGAGAGGQAQVVGPRRRLPGRRRREHARVRRQGRAGVQRLEHGLQPLALLQDPVVVEAGEQLVAIALARRGAQALVGQLLELDGVTGDRRRVPLHGETVSMASAVRKRLRPMSGETSGQMSSVSCSREWRWCGRRARRASSVATERLDSRVDTMSPQRSSRPPSRRTCQRAASNGASNGATCGAGNDVREIRFVWFQY